MFTSNVTQNTAELLLPTCPPGESRECPSARHQKVCRCYPQLLLLEQTTAMQGKGQAYPTRDKCMLKMLVEQEAGPNGYREGVDTPD